MFGYVKTDIPNLYVKDTVLYRSMYCGLCKGICKSCGYKARLCLNYDLTFLSVLLHNVAGIDVNIRQERCVIHWFTKRPVAVTDALTEKIAALNIILAYHKLNDDVLDSNRGRLKRLYFKNSYKRAALKQPELEKIVSDRYAELLCYEKSGGDSADISGDPFGCMMRDVVKEIMRENSNSVLEELGYVLGKWIYLIDAADDFDKDKKKGNFNVFVNMYKEIPNKNALFTQQRKELEYIFGDILDRIAALAGKLDYKFNHDLTDNVLYKGLLAQTKIVLENKKCRKTTKF